MFFFFWGGGTVKLKMVKNSVNNIDLYTGALINEKAIFGGKTEKTQIWSPCCKTWC
jgi:hypothetical protein